MNKILTLTMLLFLSIFFAASSAMGQTVPAADDNAIMSQINDKIKQDPILESANITVRSKHGMVDLTGLVDTNLQAEKVVTLAESVDGVKDVNSSNVKVKDSKAPLTDTFITAKVKGLLMRNKILDVTSPGDIKVETHNGAVYISGTAADKEQERQIIDVAKSVKGVRVVKSSLQVKSDKQ